MAAITCGGNICGGYHAWRRGAHRERLDARVGRLHERRERVLHLAQVEDQLRARVVGEARDVVAEEAVEAELAAEALAEPLGRHLLGTVARPSVKAGGEAERQGWGRGRACGLGPSVG